MDRVREKVALVTGGALGLGKAQALMLAREGASVVVTDLLEEEGNRVTDEICQHGGRAIFCPHDVAKEEDWQAVLDRCLEAYGRLNILVNNAGVALAQTIEDTTMEQWRWLMSINLDGVFLGTKMGIIAMKSNGGGSIINISSIEGLIGDPNLAAYNASKGGVRLLTKSAALHCARAGYNIRVNSVHPGYVWTPMVSKYAESHTNAGETRQTLDKLHPIGHMGEPDDIAFAVLYLASDESKFVTGSELVIDGGYTAQ